MRFRSDPDKHQLLIDELLSIFKELGYRILGADGVNGAPPVRGLHNDGYGDQEEKAPDLYAFDEQRQRYVIGEAKTGESDLETEHALTQYNVFLDQFDKKTGQQALLYVIVPSCRVPEFSALITHYIHPDYWKSIVLVSSRTQTT
jgi:hypothetical protein